MDQTFELPDITAGNTDDRIGALVAAADTQIKRIRSLKTKPNEEERRLTADLVETAADVVETMQEYLDEGHHRQAQAAATTWQQRHARDAARAQELTEAG
jgi:hypothetical protein